MNTFKKTLITVTSAAALLLSSTAFAGKPEKDTVVQLAAKDGNFSVLLLAAGLYPPVVDYLNGKGQRTVFAPSDAAFVNLANVLPALCFSVEADPTENLVAYVLDNPDYILDVLLYHVAKGRKDAGEVLPADQIRTLNGEFITRTPESLELDNPYSATATITRPNLFASNGVVHEISQVLLPSPPPSYCP